MSERRVLGAESHSIKAPREITDLEESFSIALVKSLIDVGLDTFQIMATLEAASAKAIIAFSPTIEAAKENATASLESTLEYIDAAWKDREAILNVLEIEMEKTN